MEHGAWKKSRRRTTKKIPVRVAGCCASLENGRACQVEIFQDGSAVVQFSKRLPIKMRNRPLQLAATQIVNGNMAVTSIVLSADGAALLQAALRDVYSNRNR